MGTFSLLLYVVAAVLFALDALGSSTRFNLTAAGLTFLTAGLALDHAA